MVDTSSPRLMSELKRYFYPSAGGLEKSIRVHMFWPPLLLDLLLLLLCRRRRYCYCYCCCCCCCCCCCAVTRFCVRSKNTKRETVCCDGLCSAMHRGS